MRTMTWFPSPRSKNAFVSSSVPVVSFDEDNNEDDDEDEEDEDVDGAKEGGAIAEGVDILIRIKEGNVAEDGVIVAAVIFFKGVGEDKNEELEEDQIGQGK